MILHGFNCPGWLFLWSLRSLSIMIESSFVIYIGHAFSFLNVDGFVALNGACGGHETRETKQIEAAAFVSRSLDSGHELDWEVLFPSMVAVLLNRFYVFILFLQFWISLFSGRSGVSWCLLLYICAFFLSVSPFSYMACVGTSLVSLFPFSSSASD